MFSFNLTFFYTTRHSTYENGTQKQKIWSWATGEKSSWWESTKSLIVSSKCALLHFLCFSLFANCWIEHEWESRKWSPPKFCLHPSLSHQLVEVEIMYAIDVLHLTLNCLYRFNSCVHGQQSSRFCDDIDDAIFQHYCYNRKTPSIFSFRIRLQTIIFMCLVDYGCSKKLRVEAALVSQESGNRGLKRSDSPRLLILVQKTSRKTWRAQDYHAVQEEPHMVTSRFRYHAS